ncbi:conjugative transposon protein TraN [Solitalea lacus]|uniref:conjugative transposon protein TraN n=1 Tax=Solitalea lacus TaxID=2911172 RepID=UPI001EDC7023|nr:conjugative transposon protein TraN [Solitalea lacus]UKJ09232.1 conjugative transposon protein TraN [Solitalea lacus]
MKKICVLIITGIIIFLNSVVQAQQVSLSRSEAIVPCQLLITFSKTTSIVFPFSIKSIDRGSSDVLVQQVKNVSNVMLVKAAKEGFNETNLTVITADGSLYSFLVNYASNPTGYAFQISKDTVSSQEIVFTDGKLNELEIARLAERIVKEKPIINKKDKKYGIGINLLGIYVKDDELYFQLRLKNCTNIRFDVEQLRFTILDQKQSKRTAIQQLDIIPIETFGNVKTIKENTEEIIVVAFPKFTVSDKKYLQVQLMEHNGGRNLSLKVRNPTIIKAKPIALE